MNRGRRLSQMPAQPRVAVLQHAQVCARVAEPGIRLEAPLDLGEEGGCEVEVGVNLGHDVPGLRDMREPKLKCLELRCLYQTVALNRTYGAVHQRRVGEPGHESAARSGELSVEPSSTRTTLSG